MGLDNGIIVKSNRRKLTQSDLPKGITFPFDMDMEVKYNYDPEICYWRKCWGLRGAIIDYLNGDFADDETGYYTIEEPNQIIGIMRIIMHFMDEEVWRDEGDSIWEYDEIKDMLQYQIINLALIAGFMHENPDVYCKFYDSY